MTFFEVLKVWSTENHKLIFFPDNVGKIFDVREIISLSSQGHDPTRLKAAFERFGLIKLHIFLAG